jgi:hypothetical protein
MGFLYVPAPVLLVRLLVDWQLAKLMKKRPNAVSNPIIILKDYRRGWTDKPVREKNSSKGSSTSNFPGS